MLSTLILLVVMEENWNLRQTLSLPLIFPPVTSVQAEPFQYCTSYPLKPYELKVMVSVGSEGLE